MTRCETIRRSGARATHFAEACRMAALLALATLALSLAACNKGPEVTALVKTEPAAVAETPLARAAIQGDDEEIRALLKAGADINAKDRIGMTALHAAVISGGRQEVEVLLEKKADIKAKSDVGQTALHYAAATGQPRLTKFLIEHGADPQSKDAEGKTPLFYAVQNKHPQTTAVLQQYAPKDLPRDQAP